MHRIDTKTAQRISSARVRTVLPVVTPRQARLPPIWMMTTLTCCRKSSAAWWRHPVPALEKGRHDQLLTALRALLLSRKNPFGDIKSDGTVKTALQNLGLGDTSGYVGRRLSTRVFTSSGTYTPTPGNKTDQGHNNGRRWRRGRLQGYIQ